LTGYADGYNAEVTMASVCARRAAFAVGAAIFVAGLTGCSEGGRGTPSGPLRAAQTFEAALSSRDTSAACDLLASPTREELEQSEGQACPQALQQQDLPSASVEDVDVWGDEAIARARGEVLFLTNVAGSWMVSAAGCKPQSDQPYQCEVKGS
jgi:hypothetical protein